MALNVLLVDDHVMFREGLRALLNQIGDVVVVGESDNGRLAVQMVQELQPDLVIVDVGIRELDGIRATRQILEHCPRTRVIALSMQSDAAIVQQMLDAGALGYVIKDSAFEEVTHAIHAARERQVFISPALKHSWAKQSAERGRSGLATLTPRERDVLRVLVEGKTTKQVAAALGISPKTIDTHRQHIMQKLGVQTVTELALLAIREKFVAVEGISQTTPVSPHGACAE